jgi:sulfite exporter TauE/SafE
MLFTAIILGFTGSLHCAGMCSPLAMAVTSMRSPAFINRVVYNVGRITMYGILGALISTIGYVLPIQKFQNTISITLGVILIAMASIGRSDLKLPYITAGIAKFSNRIKIAFSKFVRIKTPAAMFFLGSLNGLLPCGLSFLALTLCITMESPFDGFVYMFTFGIGTLPVMLGLASIVNLMSLKLKWNIKSLNTGLMVLSGILLIARVFISHAHVVHHEHANLVDVVICR